MTALTAKSDAYDVRACSCTGDSPPQGKENGPQQVASTRSPPSSAAAASQPNLAAGLGRSQSTNIRDPKRSKHQGLAALLDSPELPPGRAGPYALRRDLRAGKPSAIAHREPSLAHLAASNLADHSVHHAVAAAGQQQSQHQSPAKASSCKSDGFGASEQQNGAVGDHGRQDSFSGFAPSSAGNASQMSTPFSQPLGLDPLDAFAHLPEGLRIQLQNPGSEDMSRANSLVYNHVGTYPSFCVFHLLPLLTSASPHCWFVLAFCWWHSRSCNQCC